MSQSSPMEEARRRAEALVRFQSLLNATDLAQTERVLQHFQNERKRTAQTYEHAVERIRARRRGEILPEES